MDYKDLDSLIIKKKDWQLRIEAVIDVDMFIAKIIERSESNTVLRSLTERLQMSHITKIVCAKQDPFPDKESIAQMEKELKIYRKINKLIEELSA